MNNLNVGLYTLKKTGSGFSLIELMVAIAIGMLLLIGMVAIFVNSNQSYLELQKSAQQIEAGRYAVQVVSDDLREAGYYGDFSVLPDISPLGSTLPDPCATALTTAPYSYLAVPIQGYNDPSTSPINCLDSKDLVAGTDILVIRRADTEILSATNKPITNELYIQGRMDVAEVSLGGNSANFLPPKLGTGNVVNVVGTNPSGVDPATVLKKLNDPAASPTVSAYRVAADIRKLHTHIYFVAPCSRPKGGGLNCKGDGTDDNGSPIPTLKRLELSSSGGVLGWNIVPLVEGVENFQVEYGVDTTDPITGTVADGMPDGTYVKSITLPADFAKVVSARIFVLARNTTQTAGYSSAPGKAYCLTSLVAGACPAGSSVSFSDNFKRHSFSSEVRLVNPGGRREIP